MTKKKQPLSEEILLQLFEGNEAKHSVDVLPGKVKAVISNLNAKDQLDIEAEMSATDGSNAYILHLYSLKLLSKTIIEYNGQSFENSKECERFLEKLPSMVLDKLVKLQNDFEKLIRETNQTYLFSSGVVHNIILISLFKLSILCRIPDLIK